MTKCAWCGDEIMTETHGRWPKRYCNYAHKQAAYRARRAGKEPRFGSSRYEPESPRLDSMGAVDSQVERGDGCAVAHPGAKSRSAIRSAAWREEQASLGRRHHVLLDDEEYADYQARRAARKSARVAVSAWSEV